MAVRNDTHDRGVSQLQHTWLEVHGRQFHGQRGIIVSVEIIGVTTQLRVVKVFFGSPSGLEVERGTLRSILEAYNESDAKPSGILFEFVGYETVLGGVGRPQELLNTALASADYFVLMMWDRFGSPTGHNESGATFDSGTEEEYLRALELHADPKAPMRGIACLFKRVEPRRLADMGPQLAKVQDFKAALSDRKEVLYHDFEETAALEALFRRYLGQWLRDHGGRGWVEGPPTEVENFAQPDSPPGVREALAQPGASKQLVDDAWELANAGRHLEAEALFAQALVTVGDAVSLFSYGEYLLRSGRPLQAEVMFARLELLGTVTKDTRLIELALSRRAIILERAGNLDAAEELHSKALAIAEASGSDTNIAVHLGNLSSIDLARANYKQAVDRLDRVMRLVESDESDPRLLTALGNRGIAAIHLGNEREAEALFRRALALSEKQGRLDDQAKALSNLASLNVQRGDLRAAEDYLSRVLPIERRFGRAEGIALSLSNLGLVRMREGRIDEAEPVIREARSIYEQAGILEGVMGTANQLAGIEAQRGHWEGAEAWHRESLELARRGGFRKDEANALANIGTALREQDKSAEAVQSYDEAIALYTALGLMSEATRTRAWREKVQ